jgi:hypothetical protein
MRKIIRKKKKKKLSTLKYSYTTGGDNYKKVSTIRESSIGSIGSNSSNDSNSSNVQTTKTKGSNKLAAVNAKINSLTKKLNELILYKNNNKKLLMEAERLRKEAEEAERLRKEAEEAERLRKEAEEEAGSTLSRIVRSRVTRLKNARIKEEAGSTLSRIVRSRVTRLKNARIKEEEEERRKSEQKILDYDIRNVVENLEKLYTIKDGLTKELKQFTEGLTSGLSTIFSPTNTNIPLRRSSNDKSRIIPSSGSMRNSTNIQLQLTRIPSLSREVSTSKIPTSSMRKSIPIDNSELMMSNLQTILATLANVWKDTIQYDKKNNIITITIPYVTSFDFQFKDIKSIKTLFTNKYETISGACYLVRCSPEIKDLIYKLKNSKEDKQTYTIIIDLLNQYIEENIHKPRTKPEDIKALKIIRKTIESLEKIGGGKLRKVRKTNVIKKRTTRVIRNRKL